MAISTDLIIVIISVLILIGYLFEITYRKFRVPSIVVLIVSGVVIKWFLSRYFHVNEMGWLDVILKVLGTIGLILIVLEGTLELKIRRDNLNLIRDGFVFSFLEIVLVSLILCLYITSVQHFDWYQSVVNVLPFAVVSSAIAIPASQLLNKGDKFFVIYQSSFSDVLGVLIFNFFVLNEVISWGVVGQFFLQIVLLLIISVAASIILSFLLNRIKHK
ncbi:MAG: sodium:proton antiporter, partial [Bacteroidetes bacterium]